MSTMTETNLGGMTVGIDLAKSVFAVHCVDENGKAVLIKPKVSRDQLLPLMAQVPACPIGMEACSGAHRFREYGHTVKRIAPKFATPCRMRGLMSEFGIVLPQKVACLRPEGSALVGRPAHRSGGSRRCAGQTPDTRSRHRPE